MGNGQLTLPNMVIPTVRARVEPRDRAVLQGRRVVAFAGIGRPEKFFAMLQQCGANILAAQKFDDHHTFTPAEMGRLRAVARGHKAHLVTTEKDYYRLPLTERDGIVPIPIDVVFEDQLLVNAILDKVMPSPEERMR